MLLAASEAVGPQLVASLLHKRAAAHKNPKVRVLLCSCVIRKRDGSAIMLSNPCCYCAGPHLQRCGWSEMLLLPPLLLLPDVKVLTDAARACCCQA
jgi:hypothetical protein